MQQQKPRLIKNIYGEKKLRPKTVKRSELSVIRMAARDDRGAPNYDTVIDHCHLMHYVGIGWVDEGRAQKGDYAKYPTVID